MTKDSNWHISKGVNLSFIFALVVQLSVGIWFFSGLSERVVRVEKDVKEHKAELDQENLRQWARINENEEVAKSILSQTNTTSAILQRLERDIQNMREDMRRTNELLREYMKSGR